MTQHNEAIMDLYDGHIRLDAGGEAKSSEAMEAILPQVVDLIINDERDINSEARSAIRAAVVPARSKRANSLKKDLEWFLDGFKEDGVYLDPLYDLAYGLGRADGMDKTLRRWTEEDFDNLVITRYKVSAETAKAVLELEETTTRVVERMRATGSETFGDVAWR